MNSSSKADLFDVNKCYVRITGIRNNKIIEFDFAIGEPEMYVELALPFEAYQEFCANNDVINMTAEEAAAVDYDRMKWRYGKPGIKR
jgi:phenol hydroxylase P0 protein